MRIMTVVVCIGIDVIIGGFYFIILNYIVLFPFCLQSKQYHQDSHKVVVLEMINGPKIIHFRSDSFHPNIKKNHIPPQKSIFSEQ